MRIHQHTYTIVTTDSDGCEHETEFTGSFEKLVSQALRALQGRPNWQIDISVGNDHLGWINVDWRGLINSVELTHPDHGRPWSMGGADT